MTQEIDLRHRELMQMLPRFYDDAPEVDGLLYADAVEIERVRGEARDLLAQLSIATATWGLSDWERVLELPPRPNSNEELRRTRILAKLRGAQPATLTNMLSIINVHVPNKDARIVELSRDGEFDVYIPYDNTLKLNGIYADLNEYKPAHLTFLIVIVTRIADYTLSVRHYTFPAVYPICNVMQTADKTGVMANALHQLQAHTYHFDAFQPICGTFITSTISTVESTLNVELANEYRNVHVYYPRTGTENFVQESD